MRTWTIRLSLPLRITIFRAGRCCRCCCWGGFKRSANLASGAPDRDPRVTPADRGASGSSRGLPAGMPSSVRGRRQRSHVCVPAPRIRSERGRGSRYQLIAYQDPEQTKAIRVSLQLWGRTPPPPRGLPSPSPAKGGRGVCRRLNGPPGRSLRDVPGALQHFLSRLRGLSSVQPRGGQLLCLKGHVGF